MKIKIIIIALLTLTLGCSSDDDSIPPVNETPKSEAKQITSFVFNESNNEALNENRIAVINEADKTIVVTVPYGTNITALQPTVAISEKATVNPTGVQDFSSLVDYTVTAEDGTETIYEVTVAIAFNDAKEIISFQFLATENDALNVDVEAEIDEENKTITGTVPYGTDITTLLPSLEISTGATTTPEGVQDYTNSVNYTVTAQNSTETVYEVIITIAVNLEREALIVISNANPDNTLGWDINNPDSDISAWQGVVVNENGNVIELILHDNVGGFNLTVLPKEIKTFTYLNVLDLTYNPLEIISEEIGNLPNLTVLYLFECSLETIPSEIGNLTNLMELDLGGNNIEIIPEQIYNLINLTKLWLGDNHIVTLSSEIGNLTNLTYLNLSNNEFVSIQEEIGNLTNLLTLDLRSNLDLSYINIPQAVWDLENTGTNILVDP